MRQRLLDAITLFQELSRDKGILDKELSAEEKTVFLNATRWVHCDHPNHRFRSVAKGRKQSAVDRQMLENTGIRRLRNLPVYITPSPLQPQPPPRLTSSASSSSQPTPPPSSSQLETTTSGTITKRGGVKKEEGEGPERAKDEAFEIPGKTTTNTTNTTEYMRRCYVCKVRFASIHHFYDQLCPNNDNCAPLNFRKRGELADLTGKVREDSAMQGSTGIRESLLEWFSSRRMTR